jgi:hypothetical protein
MESQNNMNNSGTDQLQAMVDDISTLIIHKQDFVAFVIISIGIEFLGSFFDSNDFTDLGQSEIRFKNALSKLFKNNWYGNNSDWMYRHFRGFLIHQYRPSTEILLTSKCKNGADLNLHLKMQDKKRIFVLEKLFEEFKTAIKRFTNEVKKGSSLNKEKLQGNYMSILSINQNQPDSIFGQNINTVISSSGNNTSR